MNTDRTLNNWTEVSSKCHHAWLLKLVDFKLLVVEVQESQAGIELDREETVIYLVFSIFIYKDVNKLILLNGK